MIERRQDCLRNLTGARGRVDDVRLIRAKTSEPLVQLADESHVALEPPIADPLLRGTSLAGLEIRSKDGAVHGYPSRSTQLCHAVDTFREERSIDDHGVPASRNWIADTATLTPSVSFCDVDSGNHGSTQPLTMNRMKSSIWM